MGRAFSLSSNPPFRGEQVHTGHMWICPGPQPPYWLNAGWPYRIGLGKVALAVQRVGWRWADQRRGECNPAGCDTRWCAVTGRPRVDVP